MLETNVFKFYLLTQLLSLSSEAKLNFHAYPGGGGGGGAIVVTTSIQQVTSKRTADSPKPPSATDNHHLSPIPQTSSETTTTACSAKPSTTSKPTTLAAKSTPNQKTQVHQNQLAMQGGGKTFDSSDWVNGHIAVVAGVLVTAGIAVLILIFVFLIKSLCGAAKVESKC